MSNDELIKNIDKELNDISLQKSDIAAIVGFLLAGAAVILLFLTIGYQFLDFFKLAI